MENQKSKRGRPPKPADERKFIRGKYTPASGALANEYNRKTYFNIRLHKRDKTLISAAAAKAGLSLNGFVEDAVFRRIKEVLTDDEMNAVKEKNE